MLGSIGMLRFCLIRWRRDRDSNPGYLAVYTLSKRAPSATRPSLQRCTGQPSDFTTCGVWAFPRAVSCLTSPKANPRSQRRALPQGFLRFQFEAELLLERGEECDGTRPDGFVFDHAG